jgi:hypothetical protein
MHGLMGTDIKRRRSQTRHGVITLSSVASTPQESCCRGRHRAHHDVGGIVRHLGYDWPRPGQVSANTFTKSRSLRRKRRDGRVVGYHVPSQACAHGRIRRARPDWTQMGCAGSETEPIFSWQGDKLASTTSTTRTSLGAAFAEFEIRVSPTIHEPRSTLSPHSTWRRSYSNDPRTHQD